MVRLAAGLLLLAAAATTARGQGVRRTVTIVATPGRLAVPASVASGPLTFVLQNRAGVIVSAQLFAVRDDHTPEEAVTLLAAGEPRPEWIFAAGGVGPLATGGTAGVTHSLPPGGYVIASTVPDASGTPQLRRGYIAAFRASGSGAQASVTGVTAALAVGNNAFRLRRVAERDGRLMEWIGRSRGLSFARGERIIEVETGGGVAHEVALVRMDSAVTLRQYVQWFERGQRGPAPGRPSGGVGILPPGRRVWLHVRLERGTYWFYCNTVHQGGRRGWETGEYAQIAVR